MHVETSRRPQLQLWPLIFAAMIATFYLVFTGPILKGRATVAQAISGDAATEAAASASGDGSVQIDDEANPLASPAQAQAAASESANPIAGFTSPTPNVIAGVSAGVMVIAGVLVYLLKRKEEPSAFDLITAMGNPQDAQSNSAVRSNTGNSNTGNSVPLA